MYDQKMEELISAAIADGVLNASERQVLYKAAQERGIDLDELEMIVQARLAKVKTKHGNVKKCPHCGATVNTFKGNCDECGYVFEGVDVISSAQKLSDLLMKCKDNEEAEKVIAAFPIPLTKSDLIQFITAIHGKVFDADNQFIDVKSGYFNKYSECIQKCRFTFANDPDFVPYLKQWENAQYLQTVKEDAEKRGMFVIVFTTPLLIALGIILGIYIGWGFWMWIVYGYLTLLVAGTVGYSMSLVAKKQYIASKRKNLK